MGVFERFERRLERLVEGTFAKVFKDEAQPADIARALQRETDERRVIVGAGHVIAPNRFVVQLGDHDHERLAPYADALGDALAEMVADHARAGNYTFAGPVSVALEHDPALDTGRFDVRADSLAAPVVHGGAISRPVDTDVVVNHFPRHRLVVASGGSAETGSAEARGGETSVPLVGPVTVIGRGGSADVRLEDPGVSRRHAEVRLVGDTAQVVDAGSTNGTSVNGRQVLTHDLRPGDRIQVGSTVLIYRHTD